MIIEFVLYLALGAAAGLLAGMLGVGGGLIIVPALAFSFSLLGFNHDLIMPLALATSLATIIITSISSIRAHQKKQAILWPLFKRLSPTILIGAFLGGLMATYLPSDGLRIFFAAYAILVAIQLYLGKQPAEGSSHYSATSTTIAGIAIGSISSLVGIGGGSMTVPYLLWNGTSIRNAVATSSAIGLPIAIAGTIGYLSRSYQIDNLPANSLGYIYLPAFLGIIISSYLFAPVGAKLAHQLPVNTLKKFFAVMMLVIGLKMLFSL